MDKIITHKRCSKCKEVKPLTEFSKRTDRKNQYHASCRACHRIVSRNWKTNNKEKIRENRKEYRATHPGLYEKYKDTIRKWKLLNREKLNEFARQHTAKNPERRKEINLKWLLKNPEKVTEYNHRRLAKKTGNGGRITAKEWKELCDKYGNKCLCCKRSDLKLTLDHVMPLALGGKNVVENAQPLCQTCNSKKHAKHIDYR
jgi:5-methylcytosine-specific restriction endonuclease McrA